MEPGPGQWGGVFSPGNCWPRFLPAFDPARGPPGCLDNCLVPIFLFAAVPEMRGLEVCLKLAGAGLAAQASSGAQTGPLGTGSGLSAGPAGCWMPELQANSRLLRSIPGLTSGLGVHRDKLSRERASQENWGDRVGLKCTDGRHVTDVSYRRGTRGWERRRGMLGPLPPASLGGLAAFSSQALVSPFYKPQKDLLRPVFIRSILCSFSSCTVWRGS